MCARHANHVEQPVGLQRRRGEERWQQRCNGRLLLRRVDSAINVRGANGSGAASDFDYVYVYGYGRYDGAARGRYVDDAASVEDREAKGTKLGDDAELWRERAVHGRYVARELVVRVDVADVHAAWGHAASTRKLTCCNGEV